MKNILIAVVAIVCLVAIVSLLPRDEQIQSTFVGKKYVVQNEPAPILKTVGDDWLQTSEYAGKEIQFGVKKFLSGKAYSVAEIGVDESQDPWNYVNGDWFTWESADGVTYSIRMANGQYTGYKMNNLWKPVEMMYTPTFGLGITRIIELFIFNGVLNTEIMPFIDSVNLRIKYFAEESEPLATYLAKTKTIAMKDIAIKIPAAPVKETKKESKPIVYGTKIGDAAPNFKMVLLDGREYKLSDFYGRKTIVNIWATWCGQCILEFPIINEAYTKDKNVNILAVCSDGNIKQIQKIKDKYNSKYPCDFMMVSSKGVDKEYGLRGVPTSFFLDEWGTIKSIKVGAFASYQEVEDILKSY